MPWCLRVWPIMSCLRKVWPLFSLAEFRFSMRFRTSCNLWWRSYSLTLRSTAAITSRMWVRALERLACSCVSSGRSEHAAFKKTERFGLLVQLQLKNDPFVTCSDFDSTVECSSNLTLSIVQDPLQQHWVLCDPLSYQQNALWDLSPSHQRVMTLLL